jgi:cytochrome c oxidase cbb3-type subunit 3
MKKALLAMLLCSATTVALAGSGADLFAKNCKKCHGDDGKGHTMVGRMVKAADLTSPAVTGKSDAELTASISKGKGKMAGFGEKLGDEDVKQLLAYVRTLK